MRGVDPDAVRTVGSHGEANPVPFWGTGGYPLRMRVPISKTRCDGWSCNALGIPPSATVVCSPHRKTQRQPGRDCGRAFAALAVPNTAASC
jgi:hypothetical protein